MYCVVIYLPIIKHLLFPVVFLTNIFSMNIFFSQLCGPIFTLYYCRFLEMKFFGHKVTASF